MHHVITRPHSSVVSPIERANTFNDLELAGLFQEAECFYQQFKHRNQYEGEERHGR